MYTFPAESTSSESMAGPELALIEPPLAAYWRAHCTLPSAVNILTRYMLVLLPTRVKVLPPRLMLDWLLTPTT